MRRRRTRKKPASPGERVGRSLSHDLWASSSQWQCSTPSPLCHSTPLRPMLWEKVLCSGNFWMFVSCLCWRSTTDERRGSFLFFALRFFVVYDSRSEISLQPDLLPTRQLSKINKSQNKATLCRCTSAWNIDNTIQISCHSNIYASKMFFRTKFTVYEKALMFITLHGISRPTRILKIFLSRWTKPQMRVSWKQKLKIDADLRTRAVPQTDNDERPQKSGTLCEQESLGTGCALLVLSERKFFASPPASGSKQRQTCSVKSAPRYQLSASLSFNS